MIRSTCSHYDENVVLWSLYRTQMALDDQCRPLYLFPRCQTLSSRLERTKASYTICELCLRNFQQHRRRVERKPKYRPLVLLQPHRNRRIDYWLFCWVHRNFPLVLSFFTKGHLLKWKAHDATRSELSVTTLSAPTCTLIFLEVASHANLVSTIDPTSFRFVR